MKFLKVQHVMVVVLLGIGFSPLVAAKTKADSKSFRAATDSSAIADAKRSKAAKSQSKARGLEVKWPATADSMTYPMATLSGYFKKVYVERRSQRLFVTQTRSPQAVTAPSIEREWTALNKKMKGKKVVSSCRPLEYSAYVCVGLHQVANKFQMRKYAWHRNGEQILITANELDKKAADYLLKNVHVVVK